MNVTKISKFTTSESLGDVRMGKGSNLEPPYLNNDKLALEICAKVTK